MSVTYTQRGLVMGHTFLALCNEQLRKSQCSMAVSPPVLSAQNHIDQFKVTAWKMQDSTNGC